MIGWTVPNNLDDVQNLKLDALAAPVLVKVRANYIIQLLVSIAGDTSQNLKPLFQALRSDKAKALCRKLCDLDQCLLTLESLCLGWTAALGSIMQKEDFDIGEVLTANKITSTTPAAVKFVKPMSRPGSASASGGLGGDDSTRADAKDGGDCRDCDEQANPDQPILLSVNDLLTFGASDIKMASSEKLTLLQLHLNKLVIETASDSESKYRDLVTIMIHPVEGSGQPQRSRGGNAKPKVEVLFKITDQSSIKQAAFDKNIHLFKLPADFEVVLTGTVGAWSQLHFFCVMHFVCFLVTIISKGSSV